MKPFCFRNPFPRVPHKCSSNSSIFLGFESVFTKICLVCPITLFALKNRLFLPFQVSAVHSTAAQMNSSSSLSSNNSAAAVAATASTNFMEDVTLIFLAAMIGCATPLLLRNVFSANYKRFIHVANTIQSLLYLSLSIMTLAIRLVPAGVEYNCEIFRRCQSALFFIFVV
jgi:hypothetical protein